MDQVLLALIGTIVPLATVLAAARSRPRTAAVTAGMPLAGSEHVEELVAG